MYAFINKYVINLFLKTAREGAEMICHLHILMMSEELATFVDLYTLITWVSFSEIGTVLDIMEPCYEEPCMSSTTP